MAQWVTNPDEPLPESADPGEAVGLLASGRAQSRDRPGILGGAAARCSLGLLDISEHRIGIQADAAVCQEKLQPLINQLQLGVCELRAALLGSIESTVSGAAPVVAQGAGSQGRSPQAVLLGAKG